MRARGFRGSLESGIWIVDMYFFFERAAQLPYGFIAQTNQRMPDGHAISKHIP